MGCCLLLNFSEPLTISAEKWESISWRELSVHMIEVAYNFGSIMLLMMRRSSIPSMRPSQ
jgi:hypothetical protein